MHRLTFAAIFALGCVAVSDAALSPGQAARLATAARVAEDIRAIVPADYWNRAHCVAVIPELKKAAFIFGGEYGKGVMSCRAGSGWSAPLFLQLAKGSWGFQAGAEQVDVVLLVMNESGVQKMLSNKVNLGADLSVAAGPVGRQGAVATDAALTAEIWSYSRAHGLFAGIDLSGGVLRPDADANQEVYGDAATPRSILAMRGLSAPTEATAFLNALGHGPETPQATPAAPTPAAKPAPPAPAPAPPGSTPPAVSDDVRAQALALQQAIDRVIADADAAPVATTGLGGSGGDKIAVSRDRLLQLRRQIDALIKSIDKRAGM
jgi:lipid-binding SYLF domain-containing protein